MDSNVSKNPNSHKFFKLWFNFNKPAISLKNLLKQELLLTLDLYQQNLNIRLDLELLDSFINCKLVLLPYYRQQILFKTVRPILSDTSSIPIIYSCPLGLMLASQLQMSPATIVADLVVLTRHDRGDTGLPIHLTVASSGWLYFGFEPQTTASWLERSLWWSNGKTIDDASRISTVNSVKKAPDLFSVQYIHARCCSLLRLGERARLITLTVTDSLNPIWQLTQPRSISWLDEKHNLWLTELSEYNLLRQLIVVTDSWITNDNQKWSKLAVDLSQAGAIFQADCRFLGEIKEQFPQKAIARLGLLALTRYWLDREYC